VYSVKGVYTIKKGVYTINRSKKMNSKKVDLKEERFDKTHAATYFSNSVFIGTNGEDVQFNFGLREDINEKNQVIISTRVIVTLSHFIKLHKVISNIINALEKDGLIPPLETKDNLKQD
jgi:hypothetical protein